MVVAPAHNTGQVGVTDKGGICCLRVGDAQSKFTRHLRQAMGWQQAIHAVVCRARKKKPCRSLEDIPNTGPASDQVQPCQRGCKPPRTPQRILNTHAA